MKYGTIMADPPWQYSTDGDFPRAADKIFKVDGTKAKGISAAACYPCMTMEQLCALDVKSLAADSAHLYLWTTNAFMVEAHQLAKAWGFKPKTIVTWGKVKKDGTPSMRMGYYYRGATEHILFAVRGKQRLLGPTSPTLVLEPRTPHSVKPQRFFDLAYQQSPGPYLEMFARVKRPGWDRWGNEVDSNVNIRAETP